MTFSASPTDLEDLVGYELGALGFLRSILFGQSEEPAAAIGLALGDLVHGGHHAVSVGVTARLSASEDAVINALHHFRPLAFGATFKLQDMVVEWVLHANGVERTWRFAEKLREHRRLRTSGAIVEPDLFSQLPTVGAAFWSLYEKFEPFRGALVHAGDVSLHPDGQIDLYSSRTQSSLVLSAHHQAAYVRAVCLIVDVFAAHQARTAFLDEVIQSELAALSRFHQVGGLHHTNPRLDTLTVRVREQDLESTDPVTVKVNFDELRPSVARTIPGGGRSFFSVTLIAESATGEIVWQIPHELVPDGEVVISCGDARFERFRAQP